MATFSAWSMTPAFASAIRTAPAAIDRPVALEPLPPRKKPGLVLTWSMRPPHTADQRPVDALYFACQNSHSVSVDGCQIARLLSPPAAGIIVDEIGTLPSTPVGATQVGSLARPAMFCALL